VSSSRSFGQDDASRAAEFDWLRAVPVHRFIEAVDLAHRFGARVPEFHEDDPRTGGWIDGIAELPLAQQQGRLAAAIAEADRTARFRPA
jgi:hypothetical protein